MSASPAAPSRRRIGTVSGHVQTLASLAVILITSAALRFWQLGHKSLWLDELFSMSITSHGPLKAITGTMADTNPPLYYVLQSLVSQLIGRSDTAVRILPAVAGVATTIVIYLAGRKMFGRSVGLWAAALFAVAPLGIQYSQEARMYSLLMLACSLELLAFAALVEKPTMRRALLLALAMAGVAYTHIYGYMVASLLIVPVLAVPRLRKIVGRKFAVASAAALLLFLPWLPVIPVQVAKVQTASAAGDWWMQPPSEVVSAFVSNIVQLGPSIDLLPVLLFIGLFVAGMWVTPSLAAKVEGQDSGASTGLQPGESVAVLLAVAFAPVFIGLVVSKYVTPVSTLRNSLVAMPALCLLVSRGALRLPRRVAIVALCAVIAFSIFALPAYYGDRSKGQWHSAAELVLQTDPRPVVVSEDYENALEMSTYADILGRRSGLKVAWMSNSMSSHEGTITAGDFYSDATWPLRDFLATQTRVFVVSRDRDSKVDGLLATIPGWHREWIREFKTAPVVRLWTRSSSATVQ